jgi:hypothetical protein
MDHRRLETQWDLAIGKTRRRHKHLVVQFADTFVLREKLDLCFFLSETADLFLFEPFALDPRVFLFELEARRPQLVRLHRDVAIEKCFGPDCDRVICRTELTFTLDLFNILGDRDSKETVDPFDLFARGDQRSPIRIFRILNIGDVEDLLVPKSNGRFTRLFVNVVFIAFYLEFFEPLQISLIT